MFSNLSLLGLQQAGASGEIGASPTTFVAARCSPWRPPPSGLPLPISPGVVASALGWRCDGERCFGFLWRVVSRDRFLLSRSVSRQLSLSPWPSRAGSSFFCGPLSTPPSLAPPGSLLTVEVTGRHRVRRRKYRRRRKGCRSHGRGRAGRGYLKRTGGRSKQAETYGYLQETKSRQLAVSLQTNGQ